MIRTKRIWWDSAVYSMSVFGVVGTLATIVGESLKDIGILLLLAVFVLALPKTFAKTCSHVLPHNGLKFGTSQDAKL